MPRVAASWPPPAEGRSVVAGGPPEVVQHPDLLPDAVAALVRDLPVVLSRTLGIEEAELRVDPVELPLRVVQVDTGKTDSQGRPEVLLLATDRLDLDAELVALGYRFRWAVELFFRWFKCILGCRHLLATSRDGVTIQLYVGVIASLLISLWTGKKPTKRTLEMLQFYFAGLASEEELQEHIEKLQRHDS